MKLITLENHALADLTRCFNQGFADYFVSFNVDEAYIRRRMQGARVRYDLSAGVVDESGKLVGFWLNGVDTAKGHLTAHNSGTALIPAYRGQGWAGKMYDFTRRKLVEAGVSRFTLEVIQQNEGAIRAYQRMGYRIMRGLRCLRGAFEKLSLPQGMEIRQTTEPNWSLYQSWWTSQPSWEQLPQAVDALPEHCKIFELWQEGACMGYACYRPDVSQLLQLAIAPEERRKGLGRLLVHYCGAQTDALRVNNVDMDDQAFLAFWDALGMVNTIDQYEMEVG